MRNWIIATACLFSVVGRGHGHFVFFVPDNASGTVRAVFSDTLKPDERVAIEKIDNTKLFLIDAAGKELAVKWTADKAGAFYKIELPGSGSRMLGGITDYGILQRGDSKPFWLRYYPKTIVGEIPAAEKATLGERVPVEIVPVIAGGKIRFQALTAGKPVANAEISVMVPGEEKAQDLKTDEKGFTAPFEKAGQYGVRFRQIELKSGDDKGKKYEELRHYATLVVDFNGK